MPDPVPYVRVLLASRDPRAVVALAPALARDLFPGRRIGSVLGFGPAPAPDWLPDDLLARTWGQWSEVHVEIVTDAAYHRARHAYGIPSYVPDPREGATR